MINACTKRGDVAGAEKWLTMMHRNGVEGNVVTYSTLISAYARVGNKPGAERCLAVMLGHGILPDGICYNAVIDTCAKARDVHGAEKWLAKMREAGLTLTTITYNAVIGACEMSGRWLLALAVLIPISGKVADRFGTKGAPISISTACEIGRASCRERV